jgi:hypothetical protein
MRYLGLLVTALIICVLAVIAFRSMGVAPGGDQKNADWYYAHPTERADQLKWCNENPQQQNGEICQAAVAAQTRADLEAGTHGTR